MRTPTTIFALATLSCTGCFVVPRTKTTTENLGTEDGEVRFGATKQIALRSELVDATIEVHATAHRDCTRDTLQITMVKKEKTASYRGNKDPRLGLFAAILAPITIPISAIGTGIAVLADGDGEHTRQTALAGTRTYACTSVASRVPLVVALPSGATLEATTNDNGVARVRIPDTEPYAGVVTVTAADTAVERRPDGALSGVGSMPAARTELRYTRAMPAITAVRETVRTCATVHRVGGAVKVELTIDDTGRAQGIGLDGGDRLFASCVNDGLAGARFSPAHRNARIVVPIDVATL